MCSRGDEYARGVIDRVDPSSVTVEERRRTRKDAAKDIPISQPLADSGPEATEILEQVESPSVAESMAKLVCYPASKIPVARRELSRLVELDAQSAKVSLPSGQGDCDDGPRGIRLLRGNENG
jgi:hypothetical protein